MPKPVFSHCQLYVALSKAAFRNNIKIFTLPNKLKKDSATPLQILQRNGLQRSSRRVVQGLNQVRFHGCMVLKFLQPRNCCPCMVLKFLERTFRKITQILAFVFMVFFVKASYVCLE